MPKYRVRLTETLIYKTVILEADDVIDAERKHTEMIDNGTAEVSERDGTEYVIDEV